VVFFHCLFTKKTCSFSFGGVLVIGPRSLSFFCFLFFPLWLFFPCLCSPFCSFRPLLSLFRPLCLAFIRLDSWLFIDNHLFFHRITTPRMKISVFIHVRRVRDTNSPAMKWWWVLNWTPEACCRPFGLHSAWNEMIGLGRPFFFLQVVSFVLGEEGDEQLVKRSVRLLLMKIFKKKKQICSYNITTYSLQYLNFNFLQFKSKLTLKFNISSIKPMITLIN